MKYKCRRIRSVKLLFLSRDLHPLASLSMVLIISWALLLKASKTFGEPTQCLQVTPQHYRTYYERLTLGSGVSYMRHNWISTLSLDPTSQGSSLWLCKYSNVQNPKVLLDLSILDKRDTTSPNRFSCCIFLPTPHGRHLRLILIPESPPHVTTACRRPSPINLLPCQKHFPVWSLISFWWSSAVQQNCFTSSSPWPLLSVEPLHPLEYIWSIWEQRAHGLPFCPIGRPVLAFFPIHYMFPEVQRYCSCLCEPLYILILSI